MIRARIYSLWFVLLKGSSEAALITQWPTYISTLNNTSVDMHCYQNETDYNYLYWYRQIKDKHPVLMGRYVARTPTYEEGFETGFKMWGNEKKKWSLTVDVKEDSSAVYFCAARQGDGYGSQAYFGTGTKLTVLEKGRSAESPKVEILNVSSTEVCNKEAVTLVCLASKFYPDHVSVSWDMNGEEMGNVATDNAATRDDKYYSISSRLQIPYQTWTTGKTFTCTVKFFNGTGYENHPASIRGPVDSGRNEAATFVKSGKTTMLAYGMIIVKSVIYGIFIIVVIKKQDFRGK